MYFSIFGKELGCYSCEQNFDRKKYSDLISRSIRSMKYSINFKRFPRTPIQSQRSKVHMAGGFSCGWTHVVYLSCELYITTLEYESGRAKTKNIHDEGSAFRFHAPSPAAAICFLRQQVLRDVLGEKGS